MANGASISSMIGLAISTLLLWTTFITVTTAQFQPLHTSSRWILDSSNKRFKLRCINWAGHMEAHIPEGLQHASIDAIAALISSSGFNCVRLTFSIDMALSQHTRVSDSFGTLAARTGADSAAVDALWQRVKANNPWIADGGGSVTVGDTFGRVVDTLGAKNVRVILDNHVSRASWCCNLTDGNGWWDTAQGYNDANSRFFNTANWLKGLEAMAQFSVNHPVVAGIGLRNELRPIPVLQDSNNHNDWYNLMAQGAASVHNANKDLLIMMGGTMSATDSSFLRTRPLDRSSFGDKVVWEWHTYTFSPAWIISFKNCALWKTAVGGFTGFLLSQNQAYTGPLWLSEFGFAMTGGTAERSGLSEEDYKYAKCLIEYVTGNDGDWALWAIQGNYYVRNGVVDSDEPWGLVNSDWTAWRNPAVKQLLGKMWDVTQGIPRGHSPDIREHHIPIPNPNITPASPTITAIVATGLSAAPVVESVVVPV
ncbi:glycoside hydrolase [Lindgomyces ingoldianus]|uniref:Glycoside hydrolase n=1 Tax=Lindgomyces ingoldianus TaxID=673940 RepID=A0ACB6QVX3_9PLEO|nr:glycoside hydrolase [Lindgomyces ingoldianus]KAF2471149.1 glycoside hydrolase [Lindgomyces ingoldianus]